MPVPNRVFSRMPRLTDSALRCLLAMIGKSWRFDPEASTWIDTGRSFRRASVQEATGLSSQGTRNGLSRLGEIGWVERSRAGRAYRYRLALEVPARRFTYLPSGLPGKAASFESATALRALLAIFRATWGWAFRKKDPDTGGSDAFHKRWAQLSIPELAEKTGHSTTALRQAARRLEETYVERARPEGPGGASRYRIRPEAFGPGSTGNDKTQTGGEEPSRRKTSPPGKTSSGKTSFGRASASGKTSNAVGGDLQHSCPRTLYKHRESSSREQNTGAQGQNQAVGPPKTSSRDEREKDAVLATGKSSGEEATSEKEASTRRPDQTAGKASLGSRFPEKDSPEKDFSETGFSETESGLLRKLTNAGVWPREAGKLVQRYSTGRVEANFQLWRRRKNDPEAPSVGSDGAFLRAAIAEGYAAFTEDTPSAEGTPSSEETICAEDNAFAKDTFAKGNGSDRETTSTRKAAPAKKAAPAQKVSHKQKVSPREKRRLTREEGMDPAHFHRYRRARSPEEKQFLYLDPAAGGPQPREGVPAT